MTNLGLFSDIPGETCEDWRKPKNSQLKNFGRTPWPRCNWRGAYGRCQLGLPTPLLLTPLLHQEAASTLVTASLFSPHPRGARWPVQRLLTYSIWTSVTTSHKEYKYMAQNWHLPGTQNYRVSQRGLFRLSCKMYKNAKWWKPLVTAFIFSPMPAWNY